MAAYDILPVKSAQEGNAKMDSIVSIVSEVKEYIRSMPTQETFARYQEIVTPALERYTGTPLPNVDALHLRYEAELASLHVIFEITTQWKQQIGYPIDLTLDDYSHIYPRFTLSPPLRQSVVDWVSLVDLPTVVVELFEQITEIVLTQDKRRLLGEFYTPSHIAQHLVDGLNPSLTDLMQGRRVMDPACGSGTLLATVARDLIAAALSGKVDPKDTLSQFNTIFHGFDVQPFAVLLTRWQLLLTTLPLLLHVSGVSAPTFPNIQLRDALLDPKPL